MKKTLLLAAALACSGAVAQEKEIWACQDTDATGLFWEDGRWAQRGVTNNSYLFTLDGAYSSIKGSRQSRPMKISCLYDTLDEYWFCSSPLLALSFILDQATGAAGYSSLYGVRSSDSERDTVKISALHCTKF